MEINMRENRKYNLYSILFKFAENKKEKSI